jgi:hypothetical protein
MPKKWSELFDLENTDERLFQLEVCLMQLRVSGCNKRKGN